MLKMGDRVRVISDWVDEDINHRQAVVIGFQMNGSQQFAQVKWLGKCSSQMLELYGFIFPLDELKKV